MLDDVATDEVAVEEIAEELVELLLTLLATTIDETLEDDFALLLTLTELELLAGILMIEEAALELEVTLLELARLCEAAFDETAVDEVAIDEVAIDEVAWEELATDLMLLVFQLFSPPPPPHAAELRESAMNRLARPNSRNVFIIVITEYVSSCCVSRVGA